MVLGMTRPPPVSTRLFLPADVKEALCCAVSISKVANQAYETLCGPNFLPIRQNPSLMAQWDKRRGVGGCTAGGGKDCRSKRGKVTSPRPFSRGHGAWKWVTAGTHGQMRRQPRSQTAPLSTCRRPNSPWYQGAPAEQISPLIGQAVTN
ncbi:hypothetical protein EYF80_004975 [Liparis tanakae]|uniref:Uncharacterized protein n=1 Tax=Liparis tanakae TaxID=230148 RepID=A0A4Z2J414_9TELE|nr:hypothetical protein EYF80_004975 [Liparis tanakae]